jgi:hypothetical protein
MKIHEEKFYNGAKERIQRLGLTPYASLIQLIEATPLLLLEQKDSNSGAAVRRKLDHAIRASGGWTITVTGGIDWKKCVEHNGARVCLGVEIQVSARSDLVVLDLIHLRDAIESGEIDVGVIVVPSDKTAYFMTDRCPTYRETIRTIEDRSRFETLPLVVVAFEHDGPGDALPKQSKG